MKVDIRIQPKESFIYSHEFLQKINDFINISMIEEYSVPPYDADLCYNGVPMELLDPLVKEIKKSDLALSIVIERFYN